jgi:predicted glycosyltransferase
MEQLLAVLGDTKPDIVITEAFPFGRRQMRFELLPFLDAIMTMRPRPLLFASIRDILQVNKKPGRDEETVALVRQHFHRVLVHGDRNLTRIEDTFPLAGEIADKVLYTGLVAPAAPVPSLEKYRVVVSAGGGAVGQKLLSAAVAARDLISAPGRWCVITGPNLDAASFDSLASKGGGEMDVFRFRSDFRQLLGSAELSISQAGYNTVCDVLRAGCGSLLVPFAAGGETEQTARAVKLRELGLAEFIEDAAITPDLVASGIGKAHAQRGKDHLYLNMDGARETARLLRREINRES